MRRLFALLAFALMLTAGCGAQVQPSAPVYTCPTPNFGVGLTPNYTPIQTSPNSYLAAGTTQYVSTGNSTGVYCTIVQAYDPAQVQVSSPSNVVMSKVTAGMVGTITYDWTNNCASCTLVLSVAPATVVPAPASPSMKTTTVAQYKIPELPFKPNPNLVLTAKVELTPVKK